MFLLGSRWLYFLFFALIPMIARCDPPPNFVDSSQLSNFPLQITPKDSEEILKLIENQMASIQAGDFVQAYNNYTSGQFREVTGLQDFSNFVKYYTVFSRNKNAFFGNLEFKNRSIATLQGTLTSTDGMNMKVEYDFIKEGTQWKIIGIELLRTPQPLSEIRAEKYYDFQQDISG